MRLSKMWTLGAQPGVEGLENAETEATLREALAEPAAPGEDESYRRLLAVIADDMRLRQPAPQRSAWTPWSWVPALSGAATIAILLTFAYMAGVDKGREIALSHPSDQSSQIAENDKVIPRGKYEPDKPSLKVTEPAPPKQPERPRIAIREMEPSPMNYMGNLLVSGLSREQREMLRLYQEQAKAEHWEVAAGTLEDMADLDLGSETAINALHGAAVIYQNRLKNDAEALRLYQREADVLRQHLEKADAPERRAALEAQVELAYTSINALNESQAETSNGAG